MKLSRRNTAKSDALCPVFLRQLQAGTIAGAKQLLILFCKPSVNDRSDRIQYLFARPIERRRDLCAARFFLMPLRRHQLCAGRPKLNTGKRMDRIIDTAMVRAEAAKHPAVRGIYDRITFQSGNIALPKV